MYNVIDLIEKKVKDGSITNITLSKVRSKDITSFTKVNVKPVKIKEKLLYQFTYHYSKKVTHNNFDYVDTINELTNLMENYFRQGNFYTIDADYQVLISKKGKSKIIKKPPTKKSLELDHNRTKNYILSETKPYDFLIKLGVMNKNGKVLSNRYDKFKQLNRFLEMVSDCIEHLDKTKTINIIDFGCGKSYLTFALYNYLVEQLKLDVNIIGLDLKKDVIEFCNSIAAELNYDKLKFVYGDIKGYEEMDKVDMVVTLHACDTATDDALVKAINWGADVILSVPCCQHELLKQIHNETMKPMEKHGIIKEKLSSLITDSVRGNILEIMGYSVQMLEFIDMEHTPKNILIRAFKKGCYNKTSIDEYNEFKKFWNIQPYIEKAMGDKLLSLLDKS
ncbi:methyltransferase [Vallitalea longa]|uniref:Methyltransferase n=1 Tax=Vallitalea longa TaxID=2936439 RepID=A0A9W5Y8T7_9FIRM|nr:SAM-dependent methyltransferase [Vallitalea longa]GKX28100.1 methyltransferase [Vallitalea longa]